MAPPAQMKTGCYCSGSGSGGKHLIAQSPRNALSAYALLLLLLLSFSLQLQFCNAHLDLAVSPEDVQRLLGVDADVYYVRNGEINTYALSFVIPIGANMDEINFTWQSLEEYTLPYALKVISTNTEVLPEPTLNIPAVGEIPTTKQTFTIGLKCTGSNSAEVGVMINIDVTMDPYNASDSSTRLMIRRKKICYKSANNENVVVTNIVDNGEGDDGDDDDDDDENVLHPVEAASSINERLFTVVIAGTLVLILFVACITLICWCRYATHRRKHTRAENPGHLICTSSFQHLNLNNPNGTAPPLGTTAIPMSLYSASTWPAAAMTTMTMTRKVNTCNSDYELPKPLTTEELQQRISELTVERCRIRLSCLLQEGSFGRVYRGTYGDTEDVIVKTVDQRSSQMQIMLFLQEGMLLYSAKHPGVLSVMGISIEDHSPPFVLYPATHNMRNLKLYLREIGHPITSKDVVKMSIQLSMALEHLHSHDVVHRDLAARNCVIDEHFQVKLTDNALSHDLFADDYYCLDDGENRPVKWLSLEALEFWQYSEASDSWAFAVLLWEISTLAKQPYAEVDPYQMLSYLKEGYRLAQPYNCPDELFAIMAYCWALSPEERPSFSQLHLCLDEFYAQLTRYI